MKEKVLVYVAASFRHLHSVQMFQDVLRFNPYIEVLDWTDKAVPPLGLSAVQRREFVDSDISGEVYRFCEQACTHADIVVYLGESGQDAGVEVGMARMSGTPVLGILGPLETPGVMLHGAVNMWVRNVSTAFSLIDTVGECVGVGKCDAICSDCEAKPICPQTWSA